LIYAEQGFGDAMQFARYIPQIVARGGKVVVASAEVLHRLLSRVQGVSRMMSVNDSIEGCDLQFPLMSAPLVFGTTVESIPAPIPYLSAEPEAVERWKARLRSYEGLKVGIAWAGSPLHGNDENRSMDFSRLSPLLATPGVSWFSLQKKRADRPDSVAPAPLIDFTPELDDFADTAALVANLDLVITVDTAVAHLAGGMGKPVWNMLAFASDWRWLRDRQDTPWYPNMRLFRQPTRGDWDSVVSRVGGELEIATRTPPVAPSRRER
jgi:hypothetical protein